MSGFTRRNFPVWREVAHPKRAAHARLDRPLFGLYRGVIGDFEPISSQSTEFILSQVTEGFSCVASLAHWPVSHWFRARIPFRTRSSMAQPSVAPHLPLPADRLSKALPSVALSEQLSRKPNDSGIRSVRKGASCFISPLLKAPRAIGRACFFSVASAVRGAVAPQFFAVTFDNQRMAIHV